MKCPRCRSDLIVVETEDVELDWCPACNGVWFDGGEIEILLARDTPVNELFGLPPTRETEQDRSCPRCRRRLAKVGLGSTVLDVCPDNHGIWFDAGELKALAAACETEAARTVLAHLEATFGKKGE